MSLASIRFASIGSLISDASTWSCCLLLLVRLLDYSRFYYTRADIFSCCFREQTFSFEARFLLLAPDRARWASIGCARTPCPTTHTPRPNSCSHTKPDRSNSCAHSGHAKRPLKGPFGRTEGMRARLRPRIRNFLAAHF